MLKLGKLQADLDSWFPLPSKALHFITQMVSQPPQLPQTSQSSYPRREKACTYTVPSPAIHWPPLHRSDELSDQVGWGRYEDLGHWPLDDSGVPLMEGVREGSQCP